MKPLALRIFGAIKPAEHKEIERNLLIIDQLKPPREEEPAPGYEKLFLYFAFTVRGTERPFLPTLVMDDWGNEVRKLSIYEWLFRDGDRYPRSEIFGFEQDWSGEWEETQRFLREFELSARYPTFVTTDRNLPLEEARPVDMMGVMQRSLDDSERKGAEDYTRIKRPATWSMPLRRTVTKCYLLPDDALSQEKLILS